MNANSNLRVLLVAVSMLGLAAGAPACADEAAGVTPYRPTVSNPAALSAPGWLEAEFGVSRQKPGDGSRESSLPYLLKYAFSPDFGILLGGEARIVQTDVDGKRTRGGGDTLLMLKHRWALRDGDDAPALGLEWGFKAPTAEGGLGSGRTDYVANGIYSADMAGYALDVNLNVSRLGEQEPGVHRIQWGWATTISRALDAQWSVAGELSGIARRGAPVDNQALFALGYAISKRLVLDAGFAVGLSKAAPDRSLFLGVSVLLGNVR